MNFDEKVERLEGIFAYDTGCVSSGIHDPDFKRSLMGNTQELEELLTALAKDLLTCDQGYTIEDIAKLLQWAEEEFDLVY